MDEGRDSERDDLDGVRLRSGGPVVEYQIDIPPVNLLNYTRINYWRDEMDREIVIQMAREAGLLYYNPDNQPNKLERFFQLATEWQRNKDIEICRQFPTSFYAALEIKRQGENT